MAAHRPGWKSPIHARQWEYTLAEYAYPIIGDVAAADVTTDDVLKILSPIWNNRNETASRLRGRIQAILDYAATRKWRPAGDNPARWQGHLQHLLPKPSAVQTVEHHPAMRWEEAPAFWADLSKLGTTAALALRFTILTAARTGTVIKARWSEFDLANRLWTAPANHMKGKNPKEHRYPLSAAAVAVLEEMQRRRKGQRADGYLFPGQRRGGLSNMGMADVLKDRMKRPDVTVHGFRTTFRTWVADETDYPWEMGEIALAHTVASKVEAAYQRSDLFEKRRHMADDWAKFLSDAA
jgi:integrase